MRILVVDDDPEIVSFIRRGLIYEGYAVESAGDAAAALEKTGEFQPDLVILDVMMPGMDGTDSVRGGCARSARAPILMLTARGTVADKVAGLESGADDYLVKPFDFEELLARIKALLRRAQSGEASVLRFADVTLDTGTMEVKRGGESVDLTAQEFKLLEFFMQHPRQVLKRDQIYERVWGYDFSGESNVIEVYIRYLRSKLEAGGKPGVIQTVRGVGYVLRE